MPCYDLVKDPDVHQLIAAVVEKYHGDLVTHEVSIGAEWCTPGENDDAGSPLKLHGYACAAVVRVTPLKQRLHGVPDAVITLDKHHWIGLSDEERAALIDHECLHLQLQRDSEGSVVGDDAGRPKLKMRLHDVQAGWFLAIADRHGEHSPEIQQARKVVEDHPFLFGIDAPEPGTLTMGKGNEEAPKRNRRAASAAP